MPTFPIPDMLTVVPAGPVTLQLAVQAGQLIALQLMTPGPPLGATAWSFTGGVVGQEGQLVVNELMVGQTSTGGGGCPSPTGGWPTPTVTASWPLPAGLLAVTRYLVCCVGLKVLHPCGSTGVGFSPAALNSTSVMPSPATSQHTLTSPPRVTNEWSAVTSTTG